MSSDAETTGDSDIEETISRIEALESHLSPDTILLNERLTAVRTSLVEYEHAESDQKKQDALEKVEAAVQELRDTIEQEVEEGKSTALDMVDQIERKISKLR